MSACKPAAGLNERSRIKSFLIIGDIIFSKSITIQGLKCRRNIPVKKTHIDMFSQTDHAALHKAILMTTGLAANSPNRCRLPSV